MWIWGFFLIYVYIFFCTKRLSESSRPSRGRHWGSKRFERHAPWKLLEKLLKDPTQKKFSRIAPPPPCVLGDTGIWLLQQLTSGSVFCFLFFLLFEKVMWKYPHADNPCVALCLLGVRFGSIIIVIGAVFDQLSGGIFSQNRLHFHLKQATETHCVIFYTASSVEWCSSM